MSLPDIGYHQVTLNDIEIDGPGRLGLNSYVFMQGARRRRKNRVRPGVDGKRGSRGFKDPRDVQFEVFLDGRYDYEGVAATDPVAAVEEHCIFLRTDILDDPGDEDGCVPIVVTSKLTGVTYEGRVQVNDLTWEPGIGAQTVVFDLTILQGDLDIVAGS